MANSQHDNGISTNREHHTMCFAAKPIKHLSNRHDQVARLGSERESLGIIRE